MIKLPIPGVTGIQQVPTASLGKILGRLRISGGTPGFGGMSVKSQSFGQPPFKSPGAMIKNWADFKNMHFGKTGIKAIKTSFDKGQ